MSGTDYSYDEQGQFFPFFILTLGAVVIVPVTWSIFKPSTDIEKTAPRIQSDFKPQDDDLIQAQKRAQKRRERKINRIIFASIGWAVMAYMVYLIMVTQRTLPKIYDPYSVLGVSRSAGEKEIDRFYKRASLKYHPDKARPDPAKNETMEMINDRWVEMTKAYKSLTDEEVRNNYLQYGHPDGKQSFSIGIALPKLIVSEGSGKYVLLFYGVLLGIVLPYTVGRWWYGTQALTKDKVLLESAGNLFREYKEDISEGGIIGALSAGQEYRHILGGSKADAGLAKVEKSIAADGMLSAPDLLKLKEIDDDVRRKSLALLWAYLHRIDLGDATLNDEKYAVAPAALQLNDSMSSITLAFGHVAPLMSSYHTSQNLIQAIAPGSSPILQLPHFTPSMAKKLTGGRSKSPLTIQKLLALPASLRRSLCSDLSDAQYSQAMKVASQIPNLQVAKAFFKVQGDRVITPSSLVQLVVKARFIPPGTETSAPEIQKEDLDDLDPDEDDLEALLGRKTAKSGQGHNANGKPVTDDAKDGVQPPLAHAPYFARDHSPRWHIFLADSKVGRIAVPPFTFTAFNKPIFDADGKPTFEVQTLKCQFAAPPQVGQFPFTLHVVCDSYVGMDTKMDIILDVRDVSEAVVVESDDEISEPDEDSLAGQMQALKTGQAPSAKKKTKKREAADEESDDDSDTEGEIEDTSETDTETDDEN